MKGLLLKDLLMLKNQMKSLLIVIVFLTIMLVVQDNIMGISFLIPFYIVLLVISTFSYDELNHWNAFSNTLPFSKKELVKSKYYLIIISAIIAFIFGFVIALALHYANGANIIDLLSTTGGALAGITITLSIMLPFFYKYGVQKGRMIVFAVIVVLSVLAGFLLTFLKDKNISIPEFIGKLDSLNAWIIVLLVIGVMLLFLYISYLVSYKIYKKLEF